MSIATTKGQPKNRIKADWRSTLYHAKFLKRLEREVQKILFLTTEAFFRNKQQANHRSNFFLLKFTATQPLKIWGGGWYPFRTRLSARR